MPEIIDCREFVNEDDIVKGLSPFQPEKVALEAGWIMLKRIDELLASDECFAFETTLATCSVILSLSKDARTGGGECYLTK